MRGTEERNRVAIVLSVLVWLAMSSVVCAAEQFAGEVLKVDVTAKKLTVKKPDGNRFTFVVDNATAYSARNPGGHLRTKEPGRRSPCDPVS